MSRTFSLEDFIPSPPPPRREYESYHPIPEHESFLALTIDMSLLTHALAGDSSWCASQVDRRPGESYNPLKYKQAVASISNKEAIYMPRLYFDKGRTRIMDGRHRLYALLDAGYTHVTVQVRPAYAPMISTLVEKKNLYSN
ncbi:hypothetical protein OSH04_00445 [Alcaligenes sp. A-TC2]|uniref:hypothetical protein n=1 Tax=Alcaligenes nematophilus TaxID=2994643 RepID=UPI002251FF4D|nr:hypothetical protein [Alcaligenes nematophilus]MCX5470173.1 hypothetical protein [Alcaligenes nematophilus]